MYVKKIAFQAIAVAPVELHTSDLTSTVVRPKSDRLPDITRSNAGFILEGVLASQPGMLCSLALQTEP